MFFYLLANTNPKVIIHFFIDEIQTDFREKPYYLVVFPEKRTVEMGQTICQMHGGHLPVPTNKIENEVRKYIHHISSITIEFYYLTNCYENTIILIL